MAPEHDSGREPPPREPPPRDDPPRDDPPRARPGEDESKPADGTPAEAEAGSRSSGGPAQRRSRDPGHIESLRARTSVGRMSDEHWTRARAGMNAEALEYYRRRDEAPGVRENDAVRASYCLECDGVLPLAYDQRVPPAKGERQVCPHCGAEQPERVRRMFNWVEIDQVHGSDAAALLPWFLAVLVAAVGVLLWLLL